jgi:hypothetical protein
LATYSITSLKRDRKNALRSLNLAFRTLETLANKAHTYGMTVIRHKELVNTDDLTRMLRYLGQIETAVNKTQDLAEATVAVFTAIP